MSFWTTLHFHHPGPPPDIKGPDLAQFLRDFRALGIAGTKCPRSAELKFGKRIDANKRPLSYSEPFGRGLLSVMHRLKTQPLDLQWSSATEGEDSFIDRLQNERQRVYRAFISLGAASREFTDAVHQPAPENDQPVRLCDWSISLDVIELYDLSSDESIPVSFMGVSIGGPGYCFPRTFRQVLDALRNRPETHSVEALCRKTWPLDSLRPTGRMRNLRTKLGRLWPYDGVDQQVDWFWGISEG